MQSNFLNTQKIKEEEKEKLVRNIELKKILQITSKKYLKNLNSFW